MQGIHLPPKSWCRNSLRYTKAPQRNPRLYSLPFLWRHSTGYLHEVFCSCSFNSSVDRVRVSEGGKRGKRCRENWSGSSCVSHQRRKKKNKKKKPRSWDRGGCRRLKRLGGKRRLLVLYRKMELPAAGEHVFAVESIEKKRSRKVCDKSTEGHFSGFINHMQRREICLWVSGGFTYPLT